MVTKTTELSFLRPGKGDLYVRFSLTDEFIKNLKETIDEKNKTELVFLSRVTDQDNNIVAELTNTYHFSKRKQNEQHFQSQITVLLKLQISFYIAFLALHPLNEVLANSKEDFVGVWIGEGRVIVAWCKQKQLSFELQVDMNGNVSGKIGDALIQHGKIRLNNLLYRWLGNRKYIIDAELSNYLIKREKIKRDSIKVILDFEKPFLVGGFHTSGSKFGGKEEMILSGTSLKLVKAIKKY